MLNKHYHEHHHVNIFDRSSFYHSPFTPLFANTTLHLTLHIYLYVQLHIHHCIYNELHSRTDASKIHYPPLQFDPNLYELPIFLHLLYLLAIDSKNWK